MAAPPHKTLSDLNGKWTLNFSLSDDPTPGLKLQGVNYLIRKAATSAAVHLTVSQSSDGSHISMKQNATSFKILGTSEEYILDWEWRDSEDPVFGELKGRSKWVDIEEARGEGEWVDEGNIIQAEGNRRDGSWGGIHFWGFEEIGGERRHVRRVRIWSNEGEEVRIRMVYDFAEE